MAASADYQDLKEFVTCSVCFDMFEGRDPRSLPCLHSFCCVCIQGVLDAARKVIKKTNDIACPICQMPVTIPGGIASKLPAYFLSRQIQTIIEQMKTKHAICKACKTTKHQCEVVTYCFRCTVAMCANCKSKHDRRHQNHDQVRVSASTIAYVVCPEHDKHVEAFCIECTRAVCSTCSFGEHADHIIKNLCSDEKNKDNSLDQLLDNHIDSADKQLARLTAIHDDFNKNIDTAEDKLDRHHDDVIKQLKKQHKSFRAELQQRRDDVNQNLVKSKALIQQGKDCVVHLKRQSSTWRRPIPAVPDAILTDTQDLMEDIKQQVPSTNVIDEPRQLVFVPSDYASLGDITEDIKPNTSSKPQRVTHDVSTRRGQHDGTKPKRIPPVTKKSTQPKATGRRSLLSCDPVLLWEVKADARVIDILPGGDVIAVRGYNGLQVYAKESGHKIQHPISDMCYRSITGVSVIDDGATVATVEKRGDAPGRLHIYTSVNGRWEHQMYNTCKIPWSVACTGDGHFIVGNDYSSMYKYDTSGQQIWENKLSFYPWYISTDHKNRILVSNYGGRSVTVYNEDGVEMFSFPAATDQRKLKPRGLCVDDEDNILVVDEDSKSVLLYDPRGQFLKKLVDVEEGPYCLALYKDSYLAVGGGYKLRMYKL